MLWVSEGFCSIGLGMSIPNSSSRSSEIDVNCAILLTMLKSYRGYISMPPLGVFVESSAISNIPPVKLIHALFNLYSLGLSLMRQRRILLVSLAGVPASNKGMSRVVSLRSFSESTRRHFASVFLWHHQVLLRRCHYL